MQKISASTSTANAAGEFTEGSSTAGVDSTQIKAAWLNSVQRELVGVIEGAGLTLDATSDAQLLAAIRTLGQAGAALYAVDTGSATAYKAAFVPAIAALSDGMRLYVRAATANSGTTPTFAPDKLTAKTIVKGANKALVAGDIPASGLMALQYDKTLDVWVLLNPAFGVGTVTATNDSGYADDSEKPVSTSWLRRAMSTIATAAGFFAIWGETGMIRLPTWLGAFIMQWGYVTTTAKTTSTASFAVTFPNACYQVVGTHDGPAVTASSGVVVAVSATASQVTVGGRDIAGSSSGTIGVRYIAVGR